MDFYWPGIGSLEISFESPKTASLRFNPAWPQDGRSEASEEIDNPTTPEKAETRSSKWPCDLRKACESEDN